MTLALPPNPQASVLRSRDNICHDLHSIKSRITMTRSQTLVVAAAICIVSALALTDKTHDATIRKSSAWDEEDVLAHWAIVIAGSSGWWNYRHQADAWWVWM